MIVAAVDDLLFSSKIRQTAARAGVEVTFARSPEAVLHEVRARQPTLVILDLDAPRIEALRALAMLRSSTDTAGVRTLGFVSHVHAARIHEATEAGIGEVLARSAFVATLPAIVASAR